VATLGIILAAGYVLWMVQRTTQGALNPELSAIRPMRKDISLRESLVVAPLVVLIIIFGFYPKPLLDVINPAVAATLHDVGKQDPAPSIQEAGK
jgi:NADH-quinone oxidoreductase subunit M